MTTNKKPAFEAFTVRESKGKSYFTKVGTAWTTPEAALEAPLDDDGPYIDDEAVF